MAMADAKINVHLRKYAPVSSTYEDLVSYNEHQRCFGAWRAKASLPPRRSPAPKYLTEDCPMTHLEVLMPERSNLLYDPVLQEPDEGLPRAGESLRTETGRDRMHYFHVHYGVCQTLAVVPPRIPERGLGTPPLL